MIKLVFSINGRLKARQSVQGGQGMIGIRLVTFFIFLGLFSSNVNAKPKVIYGEDDRQDVFQLTDPIFLDLANATAAMVVNNRLKKEGNSYRLVGKKLKDRGICESERFSNQLAVANCTGFLVADDILITAGHCVKSEFECENKKWIFDYQKEMDDQDEYVISEDSVFSCKKILAQKLDRSNGLDYAVIKLDRKVENRKPMKVRLEGKIEDNSQIALLGHPTGLPLKVSDGGRIRKNFHENFFVSNVDSFGGNSGSPVVDSYTGVVEGILVRGEQDYEYNDELDCRVAKKCSEDECRGEDATRITIIPHLSEMLSNEFN